MYAIVEVGGKQYSVKKDDIIEVEKLKAEPGEELVLDKVLLAAKDEKIEVGQPYLKDAKVKAEVLNQLKGAKTVAYKYIRRKAKDRKVGHRKKLTSIRIKDIAL